MGFLGSIPHRRARQVINRILEHLGIPCLPGPVPPDAAPTPAEPTYVPGDPRSDLHPAPAGVRVAQALARSGELVDDFLVVDGPRSLHVCNAPSPAATASLASAQEIVAQAEER